MLCDVCHNKKARIYYTEIVNGEKREQHLCEDCAAEYTSFTIKGPSGKELPIGDILTGLLGSYAKAMEAKQNNEPVCQFCGMTASEFLRRGKFGCRECYNAFAGILDKNFNTIQGANTHTGKRPKSWVPVIEPENQMNKQTAVEEKKDRTPLTAAEMLTEKSAGAKKKTGTAETKTTETKTDNALQPELSREEMTEKLRIELKQAVKEEEYEKAASLRDKIKALEAENIKK